MSSSGLRSMSLSPQARQSSCGKAGDISHPYCVCDGGDPVGNGLVASLARPGGNVTGLSLQSNEIAGKQLELLREVVPSLRRVAILANVGNPFSVLELGEAQAAARTLVSEVDTLEIRRAEDIAPAFEALKGRADALYVCTDGLVNANRIESTPWRWARDYRRCMGIGTTSKRQV